MVYLIHFFFLIFLNKKKLDIDDVCEMLKTKHGPNFMIYNLQERNYDHEKFDNQVSYNIFILNYIIYLF